MAQSGRHNGRARGGNARTAPTRRITVRIESIGAQGDGVGRDAAGAVFAPLTAPGDLAVVEASGQRGALVELLEAGPDRVAPPCPHYGSCGGCALQHLSHGFVGDWKRQRILDALARAGFDPSLLAQIVAPVQSPPVASRRRATFAVRRSGKRTVLGFNARASADVVDIGACLVLEPEFSGALAALRSFAATFDAPIYDLAATKCDNGLDLSIIAPRAVEPRGAAFVRLARAVEAAGAVRLSINGEPVITLADPVVHFGDVAVTPPPGGFLQASAAGETMLRRLVAAELMDARRIADLFSGCGAFSLPLARRASVAAFDADAPAIAALRTAAAAAQRAAGADAPFNPVRAEIRNLFDRPLSAVELGEFDAAVFDPPRAGAERQASELARSKLPQVVAVSCNPSTFARDAAILAAGGYALSQVTPVDQFAYSPHIELVAAFRRA